MEETTYDIFFLLNASTVNISEHLQKYIRKRRRKRRRRRKKGGGGGVDRLFSHS